MASTMDPKNVTKCKVPSQSTKASSKEKVVVVAYSASINPISQYFLYSMEEDFKVICAYCEDKEVDAQ